jgi:hypothetical protein
MPQAPSPPNPHWSPQRLLPQALLLGAPSFFIWHLFFPMWSFGFFLTVDAPFFLGMFLAGNFIWRARVRWSLAAAISTLVNIVVFWLSAFSWHPLLRQIHSRGNGYREAAIVNDIASLWTILFLVAICVHLVALWRHIHRRAWGYALFHAALILSQVACIAYASSFMPSFLG